MCVCVSVYVYVPVRVYVCVCVCLCMSVHVYVQLESESTLLCSSLVQTMNILRCILIFAGLLNLICFHVCLFVVCFMFAQRVQNSASHAVCSALSFPLTPPPAGSL